VNEDFVTRLGVALRDAADREERRRAPVRALWSAWASAPRVRSSPAFAALVAGIVLVAAVYGLTKLGSDEPVPAAPKVVARLAPAGGLDLVVPAAGSAWLTDTGSQTLLRMDPATRRVIARIPLHGTMFLAPGRSALWVGLTRSGGEFRLLRIDPRTNRIVARQRMPDVPGGTAGSVPFVVGRNLWVLTAEAAVRIDQRTGRPVATVRTARDGYTTRSFAAAGGDLWVHTSDGGLLRLDGATGRREATLRIPDATVISDLGMNGLFLFDAASISRVDAKLHRLWRTPIPSIGPAVAADGRLWVETTGRRGDRVLTVDPRTGRVIDSVDVGEFGAQFMAPVGSDVWMTTAGGHVIILGS
jgi:outer membrane protein assembly factor BamB